MDILDLISRGQDCLVSNRNKEKKHQQFKVKGDHEGQQISLTLKKSLIFLLPLIYTPLNFKVSVARNMLQLDNIPTILNLVCFTKYILIYKIYLMNLEPRADSRTKVNLRSLKGKKAIVLKFF